MSKIIIRSLERRDNISLKNIIGEEEIIEVIGTLSFKACKEVKIGEHTFIKRLDINNTSPIIEDDIVALPNLERRLTEKEVKCILTILSFTNGLNSANSWEDLAMDNFSFFDANDLVIESQELNIHAYSGLIGSLSLLGVIIDTGHCYNLDDDFVQVMANKFGDTPFNKIRYR